METSVSVIIPCYRCSNTIERAVDSVAKQTLRPTEVILVDDGSGDQTLEVLKYLQDKYGKNWIKVVALESNYGPSMARNKGWNLSSQEYIAFLDADDAWHPEKIEIQYLSMVKNPDISFSFHSIRLIKEDKGCTHIIPIEKIGKYNKNINYLDLFFNRMPTSSMMIKRIVNYRFFESKKYSEDALLKYQLILSGQKGSIIDLPLLFRYKRPFSKEGLSGELWKMESSALDNYKILWRSKYISSVEFCILCLWSLTKYGRRLLVREFRKFG